MGLRRRRQAGPLLLAGVWLLFLVACFTPPGAGAPMPPGGGPEYSALMVSSDLAAGPNRLVFALVTRDNAPVPAAEAQVRALYPPPGGTEAELRRTATAKFLPWPPEGSSRGVFVADFEFDRPGEATADNPGLWELEVTATAADGLGKNRVHFA